MEGENNWSRLAKIVKGPHASWSSSRNDLNMSEWPMACFLGWERHPWYPMIISLLRLEISLRSNITRTHANGQWGFLSGLRSFRTKYSIINSVVWVSLAQTTVSAEGVGVDVPMLQNFGPAKVGEALKKTSNLIKATNSWSFLQSKISWTFLNTGQTCVP